MRAGEAVEPGPSSRVTGAGAYTASCRRARTRVGEAARTISASIDARATATAARVRRARRRLAAARPLATRARQSGEV